MKTHNFNLCVNDTDSISFSRKDGKPISVKRRAKLLAELNSLMDEGILWEDDDYFKKIIAVGAKNYILDNGETVKIKGSGLKATKKEPQLKQFIKDFIDLLLDDDFDAIPKLYFKYAKRILKIGKKTNIEDWCFKITATKKVIEPTTVFNTKIIEALIAAKVDVVEGDKYYMYYRPVEIVEYKDKHGKMKKKKNHPLAVREKYKGDMGQLKLLEKLFKTAKTFHRVYDITKLPNLTLVRSKPQLDKLRKQVLKRKNRG